MKTAHTIPWEAVVQGCPPSKARPLPLVVSRRCEAVHSTLLDHIEASLTNQLAATQPGRLQDDGWAQADPMLMIGRSDESALVELTLPQIGGLALFTSNGKTSVMLQGLARPLFFAWLTHPEYRRDAFARSYVARYARFDADARAFIANAPAEEDNRNIEPNYQFLNPTSWGFSPTSTKTPSRMHWTAHNLFRSPTPPTSRVKPSPATRQRFRDIFEEPTIDRGDPFQCIPQLRQFKTLCEQSLTPVHAHGAALSLGRCRLFGVKLSEAEDCTLSPAAFKAAAAELIDFLKEAIRWATELKSTADTYSPYLQRNLALELLEIRMHAHAACLALDEACAAARYESDQQADTMGRRLNHVRRIINLFDGNLQKQLPLLRLAASTFLLENWRRLLAPCYRDLPPWWLNGCLE